MLHIYKEGSYPRTKKPITLRIRSDSCGSIHVEAVNENGDQVAVLIFIEQCGISRPRNAESLLRDAGYDTSNLPWDEDGAVKEIEKKALSAKTKPLVAYR